MHFSFHGNYDYLDKRIYKHAQKSDLRLICKYLQTSVVNVANIKYEVFDTLDGKRQSDPFHSISRASARFKENAVYRFWSVEEDPHFPHEITHLVAHTWSKPYVLQTDLDTFYDKKIDVSVELVSTSFMQEGLAIAVDEIVFSRKLLEEGQFKTINTWCLEQLDLMPKSITSVINLDGFSSLPNKVVVPFTASFSKFLLNEFGVKKYKEAYTLLKEINSPKENVKNIENVYQMSESALIVAWKSSLDS